MADTIDATEAAVELAAEHDVDLAQVKGTGAGGRIVKGDVEAWLAANQAPAESEAEVEPPGAETDGAAAGDEDAEGETAGEPEADPLGPVESEPADQAVVAAALGLAPPADPDDPTPIAIQAATTLQQLLTMDIDRQRYAAALHARAKAILEGKA